MDPSFVKTSEGKPSVAKAMEGKQVDEVWTKLMRSSPK